MKKFRNVRTGNIVHVHDAVADTYIASAQYVEVTEKSGKKPEKAAK